MEIKFRYVNGRLLRWGIISLHDGDMVAERRVWLGLGLLLQNRLRRKALRLVRCHSKVKKMLKEAN